jgi:hypothetical protein
MTALGLGRDVLCRRCAGTGRVKHRACPACHGAGYISLAPQPFPEPARVKPGVAGVERGGTASPGSPSQLRNGYDDPLNRNQSGPVSRWIELPDGPTSSPPAHVRVLVRPRPPAATDV